MTMTRSTSALAVPLKCGTTRRSASGRPRIPQPIRHDERPPPPRVARRPMGRIASLQFGWLSTADMRLGFGAD